MLVVDEIASDEVMWKMGLEFRTIWGTWEIWTDKINSIRVFREHNSKEIRMIFVLGESKKWYRGGVYENTQ
ncbi:MAG: hypothetical protein WCO07_01515 [bacterium]